MNKSETVKIIAVLKVAYPRFYVSIDEKEINLQIDTWQDMLSSEPYKLIEQAIKALICTLKFPPTIADVKEKIYLITNPNQVTEMEAWNLVLNAIESSAYESHKNFNNLPPLIQKIVGGPGQLKEWAMMNSEVVNSVVQSNFMRSYTVKVKAEKEYMALPESTKAMIQQIGQKMLT